MKTRKKILLVAIVSLPVLFATTASAEHRPGPKHKEQAQYAKVVRVEPVYKTVRVTYPERVCWEDEVTKPVIHRVNHAAPEAMIVGGILGGVIGHELGRNNNQPMTTIAGALIGTAIASEANAQYYRTGEYRVEQRQHCRVENHFRTERQLDGYRVSYRYNRTLYTTYMRHNPGKWVEVNAGLESPGRHRH
ncbi:MAG TPA: glycine zipper 2TM domain-containing protein [Gammaproteobacteria bacterium]